MKIANGTMSFANSWQDADRFATGFFRYAALSERWDFPLDNIGLSSQTGIVDGIVKRPVKGLAKIEEAKSEIASVRYRAYLAAGVERWREYRDQLKPLKKKPILFLMLNSTDEADDVADWFKTKYPSEFGRDDASHPHQE